MKPEEKSDKNNQFLSSLIGKDRVKTIEGDECAICDSPNLNFKDEPSKKEYAISGMCQDCQDKFWG